MKKRSGILLPLIIVAAIVGCGATGSAEQPPAAPAADINAEEASAPEAQEPATAEASKEEAGAAETPEEPEESKESKEPEKIIADNPYVFDGIDFSTYYAVDGPMYHDGKINNLSEILYKNADYDTAKVFVFGMFSGVEGVLSDGDSYEMKEESGTTYFWYYTPKSLINVQIESDASQCNFGTQPAEHSDRIVVIHRLPSDEPLENEPQQLHLMYDDGTEETVTLHITQKYSGNS